MEAPQFFVFCAYLAFTFSSLIKLPLQRRCYERLRRDPSGYVAVLSNVLDFRIACRLKHPQSTKMLLLF